MCRAVPFYLLIALISIQIPSLSGLPSSKGNSNFLKLNETQVIHRVQVDVGKTLDDSELTSIETNVLPESEVLEHLPIDFPQILENIENPEKENEKRNATRSSSLEFYFFLRVL